MQLQVLEAVAEEHDSDVGGLEQLLPDQPAVRPDADRNTRRAHAKLSLIARARHR